MDISAPFRDPEISRLIVGKIARIAGDLDDHVKIMDFCGTHEWTITHYGIRSLMPDNVELVAGPGCPVCITPGYYVDIAVKLAMEGVRVFTFGDVYRLPGSSKGAPRNLEEARSEGADVKIVYSLADAVKLSSDGKESVFLAVGFETTAPATLGPIYRGAVPDNLSFIVVHRLTPPITKYVLENYPQSPIRGIIAPGHVSAITGAAEWKFVAEDYGIPVVVSGFEPVDVLLSILEILRQVRDGRAELVNEYSRVVRWEGNLRAKEIMRSTCEVVEAGWRGIGFVPESGLRLRKGYSKYDALVRYGIPELSKEAWLEDLPPGCRCAEVTLGMAKPTDCPLFRKVCTPERPYGPCMVSSEGTCLIWAKYGGDELLRGLRKEFEPP